MSASWFSRWVLGSALSCVTTVVGCEGKHRAFGPAGEDTFQANPDVVADLAGNDGLREAGADSSSASEVLGPELASLGTACLSDGECSSGYCVDGMCCDSRCGEICATCVAAGSEGRCSASASDVACDVLSCPGTTECRGRDQSGVAFNCDGIGVCRTNLDCAPIDQPMGTPCQSGTGTCDGAGACIVPDKARLGEACSEGPDCAEGNCVAGPDGISICCDAPCDGVCQQCSAEGRCENAPLHDDSCQVVTCPADNPCRDFDDAITMNLCRGFGQCKTAQDCPRIVLKPDASCECDATESCRLRRGIACANGAECGSGNCQATATGLLLCCAEACAGGLICASEGSGCVECEGTEIECEGSAAIRCDAGQRSPESCANGCTPGVGCNAQAPVGFSCASSACAAGAVCQTDTSGARRCCARDCSLEGKQCASDGSCVCPPGQTQGTGTSCLLQRGDPCGSGPAQCGAGLTCVDGVCCNEACDGACESCSLQGNRGTCAFDSRDTARCAAGEQCVGRDDCRGGLRSPCDSGGDCVSGNCEPLVGMSGDGICCSAPCSGQRPSCSTDGSRCIACQAAADCPNGCDTAQGLCLPLSAPGALCTQDGQCGTGNCLTDVNDAAIQRCCPSTCGSNQRCSAQGQCQNPPQGAGNPCGADGDCATGLFCRDGVCCTSRCDRPCETCGAGTGSCNITPASDPGRCGAVTCSLQSNACRTVTPPQAGQCAALGQCVGNAQCLVNNAAAGTRCNATGACDGAGNCVADTTPPSVGGATITVTQGTALDQRTLSWSAANDGATGTPSSQLRYDIYHSFSDNMTNLAQTLGATRVAQVFDGQTNVAIEAPRNGQQRVRDHYFNVVAVDGAGNVAAYNSRVVALTESFDCVAGTDCLSTTCTSLYPDRDQDCRGDDAAQAISRCVTAALAGCLPAGSLSSPRTVSESGGLRYVNNNLDCYDVAVVGGQVFRGQTGTFTAPISGRPANLDYDYNCNGQEASPDPTRNQLQQLCGSRTVANCTAGSGFAGVAEVPACGASAPLGLCAVTSGPGGDSFCITGVGVPSVTRACN